MMIYKVIITLIVLTILDRFTIPSYFNSLKDCLMVAVIGFSLLITDFQLFNQVMLFSIPILLVIVFIDSCFRSRMNSAEKQELSKRISTALFAATQFQIQCEDIKQECDRLTKEKVDLNNKLLYAINWVYQIESKEDLNNKYPELAKLLEQCIELYSQPLTPSLTSPDLYSDMSSPHQIKHLIRELKRIRRDNTIGEKFDLFLENEIQFLEVALRNVSRRVNSKRFKFK